MRDKPAVDTEPDDAFSFVLGEIDMNPMVRVNIPGLCEDAPQGIVASAEAVGNDVIETVAPKDEGVLLVRVQDAGEADLDRVRLALLQGFDQNRPGFRLDLSAVAATTAPLLAVIACFRSMLEREGAGRSLEFAGLEADVALVLDAARLTSSGGIPPAAAKGQG